MSRTWQAKFEELTRFVAEHPSIVIKPEMSSIPSEVRPEFYVLFDAVRENFRKG